MPGSAQPASIVAVHRGSIISVRPANTGTAECVLSKGAPVLVPAFLAAYLGSGDEIQVPLGSNQAGTEIHVRKNAASRLTRELYQAPIGYVTRPKEDKRKDLFVAATGHATYLFASRPAWRASWLSTSGPTRKTFAPTATMLPSGWVSLAALCTALIPVLG